MRGGRSFSSRGPRSGDNDYGSKFRGSNNSFRDNNSSGGRFNSGGNKRRYNGGDVFGSSKNSSMNRNRNRYDNRSPDRYSHVNDRSSRVSNSCR